MTIREMEWSDALGPIRDYKAPGPDNTIMPVDDTFLGPKPSTRLDGIGAEPIGSLSVPDRGAVQEVGAIFEMYATWIREAFNLPRDVGYIVAWSTVGAGAWYAWRALK